MRLKSVVLIATCFSLGACALPVGDPSYPNPGPYPGNWRNAVYSYIRQNFVDPYSVRDSEATTPFINKNHPFSSSWTVCIRNNAKNRMGGYTGLHVTQLDFDKNGEIDWVDSKNGSDCRDAKFQPFPLPN